MTMYKTAVLLSGVLALAACGGGGQGDREFFTSGDREADQRAEQRMAKEAQLQGGEGEAAATQGAGPGGAVVEAGQRTLYERLGGEQGLRLIVDDFIARVLADPRVNWERKGVGGGGIALLGGGDDDAAQWSPSPQNVERLKQHMAQFFAVATGGPAEYGGEEMKQVHEGMQITNAEFDAAVGDLKATLDKLQIRDQEQKELLAVVESTRPQVAEER